MSAPHEETAPALPATAVTVAICTFNRAAHTARAVASVLPQLRAGDALLVVDNASTDGTAAAVAQAASGHPAVQVLLEPTLGLSVARNRALHAARSEYLIYLDDDATVRPGWIETYRTCFARPPSSRLAAVGGPVMPAYEVTPPGWVSSRDNRLDLGDVAREFPPGGGPWGCNFAVHRARALACGGFDPRFGPTGTSRIVADETELFARLRLAGGEIWWLPGAVIDHTVIEERIRLAYFFRTNFGLGRSAARQRLKQQPRWPGRLAYRLMRLVVAPLQMARCGVAGAVCWAWRRPELAARQMFRVARELGFACELLKLGGTPPTPAAARAGASPTSAANGHG